MNNDTPADAIKVTQADRDLVYDLMLPLATSAVERKALDYIKQGRGDDADAVQAVARHRTSSLAAQAVPIRLRYEYAKGSTIEDMRSNLSEQLRNAGDCKLMWVNEGDLGIVEMMAASPAPSLAAQDGLVDALREIADPIGHIQNRAKAEGRQIDGHMAIVVSNDANYLKSIALAALASIEEAPHE